MKASLQWLPGRDEYGLWLTSGIGYDATTSLRRPGESGVWVGRIEKGRLVFREEPAGKNIEPTITIPGDAIETLREAFAAMPYSGTSAGHLRDAVQVRDRLLSLVERLAK